MEEEIDQTYLVYETNKYTFSLQQFNTIRPFGDGTLNVKLHKVTLIKNKVIY